MDISDHTVRTLCLMSFLGGKKEHQKANAAAGSEERQTENSRGSAVCRDKQQAGEQFSSVSSLDPGTGL